MTDRERFDRWYYEREGDVPAIRVDPIAAAAWEGWQAATAAAEQDKWAAVRKCFEIVRKWEYSGTYISDAIKVEFPEAFK